MQQMLGYVREDKYSDGFFVGCFYFSFCHPRVSSRAESGALPLMTPDNLATDNVLS